jgi:DinB family protein
VTSTAADRVEVRRRLAAVPERLTDGARSAVGRPVPAGEWGPPEVIRHLIAVEAEVWHTRLSQLEAAEKPAWPWVEPAPWAGDPGATLDDLLGVFAERREQTVAILDGLDEAGWGRTGLHATWGELDVVNLMTRAVDHDDEHVAGLEAPEGRIA